MRSPLQIAQYSVAFCLGNTAHTRDGTGQLILFVRDCTLMNANEHNRVGSLWHLCCSIISTSYWCVWSTASTAFMAQQQQQQQHWRHSWHQYTLPISLRCVLRHFTVSCVISMMSNNMRTCFVIPFRAAFRGDTSSVAVHYGSFSSHIMRRHIVRTVCFVGLFVGHANKKIDEVWQQVCRRGVGARGRNFAGS